jgi:hypothetical protein
VLTRRNDGGGEGRGHGRQHVEMELELEVVASCRVVPPHGVNLISRNC